MGTLTLLSVFLNELNTVCCFQWYHNYSTAVETCKALTHNKRNGIKHRVPPLLLLTARKYVYYYLFYMFRFQSLGCRIMFHVHFLQIFCTIHVHFNLIKKQNPKKTMPTFLLAHQFLHLFQQFFKGKSFFGRHFFNRNSLVSEFFLGIHVFLQQATYLVHFK